MSLTDHNPTVVGASLVFVVSLVASMLTLGLSWPPSTIDHPQTCYDTPPPYRLVEYDDLLPPRGWVNPTKGLGFVVAMDGYTPLFRMAGGGFGGLDDSPPCIILDDAGSRCMPVADAMAVLRATPAAP